MTTQKKNLIVNYLPSDLSEGELASMFSIFGLVKESKIVRDGRSGESLGYGFVVFVSTCNAVAAQILMNGYKIRGKRLKVAFARPRSEDIMNANLYLACLPLNVDEEKLINVFGECGKIIEVKILRDKMTGQSRGVGFVRFDLHSSALKARDTFNFYCFNGTTRPIIVKFKHPRKPKKELGGFTHSTRSANPKQAILKPEILTYCNPGYSEHPAM